MTKNSVSDHSPDALTFRVETGETLPRAAARHGISIRQDCGGKGVCGKCRILAEPSTHLTPHTDTEGRHLSPEEIARGFRLACQIRLSGAAVVTVPAASIDLPESRGKGKISCRLDADPLVERVLLESARVPRLIEDDAPSLTDWLAQRVKEDSGREIVFENPRVLRDLSVPDGITGKVTLVVHDVHGVTDVLPGHRQESLGVAFDVGTTTLAAYLCDLTSGQILSSASAVNPQRAVGEDVISRIAYCDREAGGLLSLRQMVVGGMNDLIRRALDIAGKDRADVDEVTVVGNTTMEQILSGFHPHYVGVSPYLPVVRTLPDLTAGDLGLDLRDCVNVHLFPVISGFVGGDTLGAVLAEALQDQEEITLLVDIGTNGELVLGNREKLWATSCATGPALEGAQISCGMRAASGAIDRVTLDRDGRIRYHVLGKDGTLPLGICGSGIIDAMAVLRRAGGLEASGRFIPGFPGVVCDDKGVGREFVLVPPEDSGTGREIPITLKDVRQFQLAKAALAVGISFLMEKVGVETISQTVLTGAFGVRFDWRSAVAVGVLPAAVAGGGVEPRMNLAGVGAVKGLVNGCCRAKAREIRDRIRFIEMAGEPAFATRFASATAFPDLDDIGDLWS